MWAQISGGLSWFQLIGFLSSQGLDCFSVVPLSRIASAGLSFPGALDLSRYSAFGFLAFPLAKFPGEAEYFV